MSAAALQTELQLRPHESPLVAVMRGLCIHEIRIHWLHRHDSARYWSRKHVLLTVMIQAAQLRRHGPGPVELPDTCGGGILGEPMGWWGMR